MTHRDDVLSDDWKSIPLISREVRLHADGTPWTNQRDPVMRERIREVYRKLCEEVESGRQFVAVHQEYIAEITALIQKKRRAAFSSATKALRTRSLRRSTTSWAFRPERVGPAAFDVAQARKAGHYGAGPAEAGHYVLSPWPVRVTVLTV